MTVGPGEPQDPHEREAKGSSQGDGVVMEAEAGGSDMLGRWS